MIMRDVVVVGAGPAGSTAAHTLARAGWDVVLLEAERAPGHKVCGEFLSPEALLSLQRLDVLDHLRVCRPAPMTVVVLTSHRGQSVKLALPATGWGLSRHRLDHVLTSAAQSAGVELRYGARATGFSTDATGYHVSIRSGTASALEALHARVLLWATGRPGKAAPNAKPSIGVKRHYAGASLQPCVQLHFFRGGYIGMNPIEGGRCNVCVMASHAAFVDAGRSPERLLEAAIASSGAMQEQLRNARPVEGTTRSKFPVGPTRSAMPWGRTAHIGDAVASIAPLCGDGMAMAFRSAELCATGADAYLRGAVSLQQWKDDYTRAWSTECKGRCRTGRFLQTVLGAPLLAGAFLTSARIVPAVGRYFLRATRGPIHRSEVPGLGYPIA